MVISDFLKDANLSHLTDQTLLYFTPPPPLVCERRVQLHPSQRQAGCLGGISGAENGNDAEVNEMHV